MLSSRKKRPLDRAIATRDARLIVIAAEGEKTEEIYFRIFHSTKVIVRVITSENGRSAPNHIIDNMQGYIERYQIGPGDELWLVIDRDNWKPSMMSRIARICNQKKINLAVSNPCFELWLAHHLEEDLPSKIDCASLENHLKNILGGYNKSNYDAKNFLPHVRRAIANAKILDNKPNARWPHPVGTRVHVLVESVLSII